MSTKLRADDKIEDDPRAAFERFKQAVAEIAAMPKTALLNGEPKRRKRTQNPKPAK